MKTRKRLISSLIFMLIIFLSAFNFVQGQGNVEKSGDKTETIHFIGKALFRCNIKLPENYNPNQAHNLVIGLHGAGATPESFINVWDSIKGVNFIYATPQGPYSILFKELGNEWSLWSSSDLIVREQAADLVHDYITDLVEVIKKMYKVKDVYLFGFSQGAIFTYVAGLKSYKNYKGIMAFSGAGIFEPLIGPGGQFAQDWMKEKYLEPAKGLRVFIAHGTKDQAAKYELGLKSKDVLTKYGYDVTFHTFEGGHTIDPEGLKSALDWINNGEKD